MGQEMELYPPKTPIDIYTPILRSISDPLNILDREFRIIWVNEARAKIFQRKVKEMIGKCCYEMFQRRNEPCPECPVKVAFDSGKPCVMERWVDLPDGSRRWGEVRAYPVFDTYGDIVHCVEIAIDITEKKLSILKHKRYVESLEKMLRELTEGEIRTIEECGSKTAKTNLTKRELEVLKLMAKGFSNNDIAAILSISPHTAKSHVIHIFTKLGVRDRTQAAVRATRKKLL
ncbi:MAG TPA: helix-turn-helix transcriptional regulator [Thermodesulfobacteriota bacterium]|jgi:PAS domain S-box-containing protein|nr:helix-turn-helix transcriptional regulator [Thermodesulfobacteriota bacterium]